MALLLLFIVPFTLAIVTLSNNADTIRGWVDSLKTQGLPPPPGWVSGIPLVGPKLSDVLAASLPPQARKVFRPDSPLMRGSLSLGSSTRPAASG